MQTKNLRFLHVFWFTLITPNVIMIIRKSGRSERGMLSWHVCIGYLAFGPW